MAARSSSGTTVTAPPPVEKVRPAALHPGVPGAPVERGGPVIKVHEPPHHRWLPEPFPHFLDVWHPPHLTARVPLLSASAPGLVAPPPVRKNRGPSHPTTGSSRKPLQIRAEPTFRN